MQSQFIAGGHDARLHQENLDVTLFLSIKMARGYM